MERSLTRTAAVATAALTLALASATTSFAGDCNWKKNQEAKAATYQTASANQTEVMGATIHKTGHHDEMKKAGNTIIDAAVGTEALSTLVAAVKAADLVETLSGDGPFTVFAPTNDAFAALPAGTVESLLEPANRAALQNILTAHVVAGKLTAADIVGLAEANGGSVDVQTVAGATLTAKLWNGKLYVKDETGGKASVAIADVMTSNGVVHVVDKVLLPGDGTS